MTDSVRKALNRYNMLDGVTEVTVALSGGADSVALLLVLDELKQDYGIKLFAAHLNHSLRGDESDADEMYVRELCKKMKIPFFCERAEIKMAMQKGESTELAARRVRYDFLKRVSRGVIATAHTADDNIETIIHNMIRGTGIAGICGIPPKRDGIIRPLIFVTRRQVEAYCAKRNVAFRTDSTNLSNDYTRNKIRHLVVPVLKELNSSAVENASDLSENLRTDADYLESETDRAYIKCHTDKGLSQEKVTELHPAIRTRCIIRLYKEQVGVVPERIHIESAEDVLYGKAPKKSVQRDFFAVVKNGSLMFAETKKNAGFFNYSTENRFPFENAVVRVYKTNIENYKKSVRINNLLLKSAIDCDRICGIVTVRNRRNGDSIKLSGRNVTKSFKKLFNESKTDLDLRDRLYVASDDKGVLWLCGFGVDSRVEITDKTENVLVFEAKQGKF